MIRKLLTFLLICALLVAAAIGYNLSTRPPQEIFFQGQMEAAESAIAAKVPGRVEAILVHQGQKVVVGTPLVRLSAQEIRAKLAQAEAGYQAANAIAEKAQDGARPEQIAMAKAQYQRAQAGFEFAEKSWQRVRTLAAEGLISKQKRDETEAQYKSARELRDAAHAQYQMALAGAQQQDIHAARAKAQSVAAQVQQAQIALDETLLKSPIAGQVSRIIPELGEVIGQGVPMVNIVNLKDSWVVLNVREDHLARFPLDSVFEGELPALHRRVSFRVFSSAVLPNFATWRPTRNDAGYDMRTYEVKARPLSPLPGLRPGMSVLVNLPVKP